MEAANPAVIPAGGGANMGVGSVGGLIPMLDWGEIKAKSRRILQQSTDRARCLERMKRRADDLIRGSPGEIVSDLEGEVQAHCCKGKNPRDFKEFRGK